MQRAILTGEQVKILQETGEVVERVMSNPQPDYIIDGNPSWSVSGVGLSSIHKLGTEGDLFWVAEEMYYKLEFDNWYYKVDSQGAGVAVYKILGSKYRDCRMWSIKETSRYTIQTTSIKPVEVDGVWFWERVRKVVEA